MRFFRCIYPIGRPHSKGVIVPSDRRAGSIVRDLSQGARSRRHHFLLVAACAHLGRIGEARAHIDAPLAFEPGFTIARARVNPQPDISEAARAILRGVALRLNVRLRPFANITAVKGEIQSSLSLKLERYPNGLNRLGDSRIG